MEHAEKLTALKCLQNLSENEYIRTIKCSLTGHALRVSSTVDDTKYLDKTNGSREYIEGLERLFITGQDARSARLEFNGAKQKRGETILEYFGNLLYLAKSAKYPNIEKNTAVKDKFIDGIKSTPIKKRLLEIDDSSHTLTSLMTLAMNLESIDKNLAKTHHSDDNIELKTGETPMELGGINNMNGSFGFRGFRAPIRRPIQRTGNDFHPYFKRPFPVSQFRPNPNNYNGFYNPRGGQNFMASNTFPRIPQYRQRFGNPNNKPITPWERNLNQRGAPFGHPNNNYGRNKFNKPNIP